MALRAIYFISIILGDPVGIKGKAHECLEISNELGLQNVMNGNTTKGLIKRTIAKKIKEES